MSGSRTEISLDCLRDHRNPRNWRVQVQPKLHAHEVSPLDASHTGGIQSYGSSYFLPGKLADKAATFLLDTGCTTNLLSRCLFDTLIARDRANLEPYEGEHGTFADGSCIPFYGTIELTGRVHDQVITETFIIRQLKQDAISRMPFLKRHKCYIGFNKSAVMLAGCELACVDRFGKSLVGEVQVVRRCAIPEHSRATFRYRVNCRKISNL